MILIFVGEPWKVSCFGEQQRNLQLKVGLFA